MKKISRREISKMSLKDVISASREPYRRLWSYMGPYKGRFALALLCGVLYGLINGGMVWMVKEVSSKVFPDGENYEKPASAEVQADSAVKSLPVVDQKLGESVADLNPAAAESGPSSEPKPAPQPKADEEQGLLAKLQAKAEQRKKSDVALNSVMITCLLIPLLMLVRAVFGYFNGYLMTWTSIRVLNDIRSDLFSRLLGQSMEFFSKQKSGDLMQTVFNQTRVAQQALTGVSSDLVKEPISILSAVAIMFWLDWRFTLGALVLFPLCILPVLAVSRKVRKAGAQEEEEAGAMNVIMQEAFTGIRLVKSTGREGFEVKRFEASNRKMLTNMMRWRKALDAVGQLVEVVASLGVAAALYYVWSNGKSAGEFFALNGALVMLYPPAKALSRVPIQLQKCLAATTKIFEYMDREVKVKDKPDAKELERAAGHIILKGVTFYYNPEKAALRNVNLEIFPGERVAFVGRSGSGKSTLFSLIQRFYDPHAGSISMEGHDLRDLTQQSLRNQIGVVSQDVFLFHDTIMENIRYGRLEATDEEVVEAAKRAHAHSFIIEKGYDSIIGDSGCNLSGGQRQRLAIARAFLRNAPVLMLDEATSALDTESERLIQQDLEALAEGRTVIAIAHRLSTIRNADKIAVMENGAIVAVGTHDELILTSPIYQHLYNLQQDHNAVVGVGVETGGHGEE